MLKKAAQAGGKQKGKDEFRKNSQPAKHSRSDWTEAVFIALHKGLRCRGFQLFAGLLARRVCRERFFAYSLLRICRSASGDENAAGDPRGETFSFWISSLVKVAALRLEGSEMEICGFGEKRFGWRR